MSKNYKEIIENANNKLNEQLIKEFDCIEKYKKENLNAASYIVIYKDYIEMYSIDKFNGISDIRTIKDIEKLNKNILKKYLKII